MKDIGFSGPYVNEKTIDGLEASNSCNPTCDLGATP
jgi:hypothetical protein